jgi:hypothetical protein
MTIYLVFVTVQQNDYIQNSIRKIYRKYLCLRKYLNYLNFRIAIIIIIIITAIEFPRGGSSPYTSTDKTNKNDYT